MVKKISSAEFQQVKDSTMALVDFSASWCGPCKMMAPIFKEVSEEWEGKVDFYNIDVDENSNLALQFHVMSIPALVLFKNGESVATQVGLTSKEKLEEFIQQNM